MLYDGERRRIFVRGIVQGVGFRPFLHGLATRLGLTGFVENRSNGVWLEVQGEASAVGKFVEMLRTAPPPLAVIDEIRVEAIEPIEETGFHIAESVGESEASTPISPDMAICDECLREFLNPNDRRYRYPFINCTNCGPRFTIIRDIPYDRPNTTMVAFRMCATCQAEYDAPDNRRFHAQPNACANCGPRLWFEGEGDAQAVLLRGEILAVKGIGGFHLVVDATNEAAVSRLRERKGRRDKPFALMARDLEIVRQYAEVGDAERELLLSRQRPIVLLKRRENTALAKSVAPGNPLIGFMLPYAPLHYLLLEDRPLVMTSGNLSEEPIVWRNEEARARLGPIADAFWMHDRDIHVPCDDSVVTVAGPIRRSRGYSPMPVKLSVERPRTLAVGAELKACFCLTRGDYGYLSQHIGDMENLETVEAFERSLAQMQDLFRCKPERVVCDAHPGYLSTRWARAHAAKCGVPLVEVQHHHAHAMSLMVEHGLKEDEAILAFTFDGTGYGTDGAIWGGEVLVTRYSGFERVAHLRYTPLPGGDAAVRHPARTALAQLFAAGIEWTDDLPCVRASTPQELRILRQQLTTRSHVSDTSSMGRLFDAVAAVLGLRRSVSYEGQAAIELEALCGRSGREPGYPISYAEDMFDVSPMWTELVADIKRGTGHDKIATRFHWTIAEVIQHYSRTSRVNRVGLTGGVFQNTYLLNAACYLLNEDGIRTLTHQLVPANDGGIALGQAVALT